MKNENGSSFRKAMLLLATTAAAVGVTVGLPIKKALAASLGAKVPPAPTLGQPPSRLTIVQPKFVNPSTLRLLEIASEALADNALAERIFREPDAVAAQYHLSNNERLVLRQMTPEQFQTARNDATRVVASRLSRAGSMRLPPGATDTHLITERMIVGRAILAAVGRSYLSAADASGCCPWSKAIELGVNSDPAYYNVVFQRPAGVGVAAPAFEAPRPAFEAPRPAIEVLRPAVETPRPAVEAPRPAVEPGRAAVVAPESPVNALRPGVIRLK